MLGAGRACMRAEAYSGSEYRYCCYILILLLCYKVFKSMYRYQYERVFPLPQIMRILRNALHEYGSENM